MSEAAAARQAETVEAEGRDRRAQELAEKLGSAEVRYCRA